MLLTVSLVVSLLLGASGPAVTSVPGVSTADPRATATPGPKTTEERFQRARLVEEDVK